MHYNSCKKVEEKDKQTRGEKLGQGQKKNGYNCNPDSLFDKFKELIVIADVIIVLWVVFFFFNVSILKTDIMKYL